MSNFNKAITGLLIATIGWTSINSLEKYTKEKREPTTQIPKDLSEKAVEEFLQFALVNFYEGEHLEELNYGFSPNILNPQIFDIVSQLKAGCQTKLKFHKLVPNSITKGEKGIVCQATGEITLATKEKTKTMPIKWQIGIQQWKPKPEGPTLLPYVPKETLQKNNPHLLVITQIKEMPSNE
jgi:hypothetical protein